MILASHQPNFLPYMNFFKKMYLCDVFTISDGVEYSRSDGYHNYNYVNFNGKAGKLLIPVKQHSGIIYNVEIAESFNAKKLLKTIRQYYSKAEHFKEVYADIEQILEKKHRYLWELNYELIVMIHRKMGFSCKLLLESEMNLPDEPNEAIIYMAKNLGCTIYLSGVGAKKYLDEDRFHHNGVHLTYLEGSDVNHHHGPHIPNLSVLDYIMHMGYIIPDEWRV